MGRSSLWSTSCLRHQMFYPYVTISAAQARESNDLRHTMLPFSLFLSFFSGVQRILGYVRPRRIIEVHPLKRGKEGAFVGCIWRSLYIGTAFARHSDVIGFQMWPLKDADPELRHSNSLFNSTSGCGWQYTYITCPRNGDLNLGTATLRQLSLRVRWAEQWTVFTCKKRMGWWWLLRL